jgi:GT2 family glycosyltransferase
MPDPAPELRVVVVDNDPDESGRPVCEGAGSWFAHPVHYVMEKRRGIPQARNTAVAAALGHSDFVAFVDDDEVPEPDWLAELLRVQQSRGADAVAGPSLPIFEASPTRWIVRGRFFESRRHTTGTRIDYAFTHNVLVRTEALAAMNSLFDETLALTGGSDAEFFRRFAATGRRIVWADSAVVYEYVPPSRMTLGWLLARAFRVGCTSVLIERLRATPRGWSPTVFANGCWCIAKAALLLVPAALSGRAAVARVLRLACYGSGRLAALTGYTYHEYRTTHGS